jgi:hypothetical protein
MLKRRVLPLVVGVSALTACDDKGASGTSTTPSAETRPSSKPSSKPAPTDTTLKKGQPLPVELGGAVAPAPRPSATPPSSSGRAAAPGAQAAPEAAAAEAAPAPAAVAEVHITHNHPPDQPCKPLSEDEIKKAFGDMN